MFLLPDDQCKRSYIFPEVLFRSEIRRHLSLILIKIKGKLPLLGVCYGAQHLAHNFGGEVLPSNTREYGRANMVFVDNNNPLFQEYY